MRSKREGAEGVAGFSKLSNLGAQTIGPGAWQLLVVAVQKISLNVVTRWHYHISLVAIMKTYINQ